MLSYRHAFHAGNHADVLKHSILCILLQHFTQKEKPFTYIDTHAGAGVYRLDGEWAQKTAEAQGGIVRLLKITNQNSQAIPESLRGYLKMASAYFSGFQYPGSPEFARVLSRAQDSLILSELHSSEIELLRIHMREDARVHIHFRNGFEQLASLPLKPRSLVLIDPSYETDSDYHNVFEAAQKALRRCRSATVAVWYPLVRRHSFETAHLTQNLRALCKDEEKIMQRELVFASKMESETDYGMYGSGMILLNAPWTCAQETDASLAYICGALDMEVRR